MAAKHPGGRPQAIVDWPTVDKLCHIQCTQEEIAAIIDVSVDTLERASKRQHKVSFAEYMKIKSAGGKMSLRRQQYENAAKGNVTMQIWLGKQYLGQRDNPTPEQEGQSSGIDSLLATLEKQRRERGSDV
jgi:hypothetical protein